jgi:hypothetical protein
MARSRACGPSPSSRSPSRSCRRSRPRTASSTRTARTVRGSSIARISVGDEIDATLEHWFTAHHDGDDLAKLQRIRAEHAKAGESASALGVELGAYAQLAAPFKNKLDGVGGFDASLVDEAHKLSTELVDKSTQPAQLGPNERAALERRNRVLNVLEAKVNKVRADARFIFRHDPATVRQATSSYERSRRKKARAAQAAPPTA